MNSKLLFSSLIIGSGSIAAGGYGVYLATTPSFNPLKMAAKAVETTKSLQKTFEELKEASKEFLETVGEQDDDQEKEEPERIQENDDPEKFVVRRETNKDKVRKLFKNVFLSKGLENLLLQELLPEIRTNMENYKSEKIEQDYEGLKNSWGSSENLTKIINLAEKFAQQIISLYGELASLFQDQENLFEKIKLGEDDTNPLKNYPYSPSLMSIPEKIFTLEDNENPKKEGVAGDVNNEVQDKIEDNIFNLKISGTPILDSEEFAEVLKKDSIFEVTTEKNDDSHKIKTLTLKLKKSTKQSEEQTEIAMWTYFGFTNKDLKEWKDIITGKKLQNIQPVPEVK